MPLYGPKWPLKKGTQDVYDRYDNIRDQISYYLKSLLLTSPGEKISDPSYGAGLRRFLFEPNILEVQSQIESIVSSQINVYLPFITINSIEVRPDGEQQSSNQVILRIIYYIPDDVREQIFDLQLNTENEIGFY